jgi:hypothetical protein
MTALARPFAVDFSTAPSIWTLRRSLSATRAVCNEDPCVDVGGAAGDCSLALDRMPDMRLRQHQSERADHVQPHEDKDQYGERTLES